MGLGSSEGGESLSHYTPLPSPRSLEIPPFGVGPGGCVDPPLLTLRRPGGEMG